MADALLSGIEQGQQHTHAAHTKALGRPIHCADSRLLSPLPCLGKRAAAHCAVKDYITADVRRVGVGSGSTVVYAVEALVARAKALGTSFLCVPTSFQARQLITSNRPQLQLSDLDECPVLDVDIDGADEVDEELNLIKGGGACMLQEKVVAAAAKVFVVIADSRKDSKELGQQWKRGIPVEVLPLAEPTVRYQLKRLYPDGTPLLRMAKNKAGPVVTDNGMFVIDWDIGRLEAAKVRALNVAVSLIPGVIETGLFVAMAHVAYFGQEDGSVTMRTRPPTGARNSGVSMEEVQRAPALQPGLRSVE